MCNAILRALDEPLRGSVMRVSLQNAVDEDVLARPLHLHGPCALSLTKEPFFSSNQNRRRRLLIFRARCGIRG